MSSLQGVLGKAGELLCGTELLRPVLYKRNICFLFDPVLIGGNEPTYDYIVYLLGPDQQRCGAFFFLQVKTTMSSPDARGGYSIAFSATDVRRAHALSQPFFVALVDKRVTRSERIYIKGVNYPRATGISVISSSYDLAKDNVKIRLAREVQRLWCLASTPKLGDLL